MTIDEAIALLSGLRSLLPEVGLNKYTASVQLGIEALKRIRKECEGTFTILLPGETKEAHSSTG